MKHRTWITEALRLHFEEHLPRVVAGRRLGVPKSTVCSMFIDRNLNPKKIKKTPQNGCLFNTACVP